MQRVPETESQGRVHTSTVTVAVLPMQDEIEEKEIDKNEFLKGYYDNWGNRVYAFYNDKDNLLINFKEAKNLGANYVVSGFNIDNEDLKLIEKILLTIFILSLTIVVFKIVIYDFVIKAFIN